MQTKVFSAEQGTLLLDEISEMPLSLQAKLLRVLQERKVTPVGGQRDIDVDVRVLATSNGMWLMKLTNQDLRGSIL